ncbi:3D domain-containing protein [bacterium]|nr:3D domain-containing protein [bacterium]
MSENIRKTIKKVDKKLKKYVKPVVLAFSMLIFSFPQLAVSEAFDMGEPPSNIGPRPEESISAYYEGPSLPEIPLRKARQIMYITVTAYNSEVGQTDDSPFITAFNTHVRDGIIATNFLPKGTLVRFPDVYGDKEFVVEDRMNKRYYYHMDIWMEHKVDAKTFGVKFLKMEIL